jgi:DNA-binding NtrC family response regulator
MPTPAPAATPRAPILVVDDDGDIRVALEMLLQYDGFEVWTAKDGAEALARIEQEQAKGRRPALVLTDLKMPKLDGIELLERLRGEDSPPPVILISGPGDVATAVDAMQRGAINFLEKPLDENRVLVTIRSALRETKLAAENKRLKRQLTDRWDLIGESPAMQRLKAGIAQVAASEAAILITGENGTGKEVVARHLHFSGPRADGPFETVNCAAIPDELIESELFGHEKGSFTGAHERRTGHFEAAQDGTLFLDEVGDIPLELQSKFLRVLQEQEFERLGGTRTIRVDVRLVAATNRDLPAMVDQREFRSDLYYRLNVFPIVSPPLRDRPEDVSRLVRHFTQKFARRMNKSILSIPADTMKALSGYHWPGNIRELENFIERAVILSRGSSLDAPLTELRPRNGAERERIVDDAKPLSTLEDAERDHIRRALEEANWLVGGASGAAARLGMKRTTLQSKMAKLGIARP